MFETVLFDLDGTLTDPGMGITNSVAYALKKYGIEATDRTQLYRFIGPPLHESFEMFYGFSKERAQEAVTFYREYYSVTGIFENRVYDGIEATLGTLRDAGKRLFVATSKPEKYARQILEHYELQHYFTYIAGANMDGTRTKKDEVIAYALEAGKVKDLSAVIMVGDREHDIFGAKKTGVASMGVLFGYGDYEELRGAGADYIAETVEDIADMILDARSVPITDRITGERV